MIQEISRKNLHELNKLDGIIASYFKRMKELFNRPEYPLKDRLLKGISESKIRIYLASAEDLGSVGFSIVHQIEGRFSLLLDMDVISKIHPNQALEIEKALFDQTLTFLKNLNGKHDVIRFTGECSTGLKQHALIQGFTDYKRARMTIPREKVINLNGVDLDPNFEFSSWTNAMVELFAELMATQHFRLNHPDGFIFAQYRGYEGCKRLLEEVTKGIFGKFTDSQTRILKDGDVPIGFCSVTKLPSNIGYIPEILLTQQYKGRGLGKALLIHSLKHFLKEEESISSIELDVTLKNTNAANLYKSLGFEPINTYSVFVWAQKERSVKNTAIE